MSIVPDFYLFIFPSVHNIFLLICVKYCIWDKVRTQVLGEKMLHVFQILSRGGDYMEQYDKKMNTEGYLKKMRCWELGCPLVATVGCLLYHWLTNRCSLHSGKLTSVVLPMMLPYESNNFPMDRLLIFFDYHITELA